MHIFCIKQHNNKTFGNKNDGMGTCKVTVHGIIVNLYITMMEWEHVK
jgi:hypothetical protein